MQKIIIIFTFLLFCLLLTCRYRSPNQPNIIFILTDDQGYGDLACHGNPWIKTPHLDKLYSESIRFTSFHVGTTCAPSRAGLMSGKYCNKVGVWHTINGREMLSEEVETLPELLKEASYHTGIFGKWHLGDSYPFRPQDRGFDEVLIHGGGGVGQQPDYWNNDYFDDTYFHNGNPEKFSGYCTDIWFSEATKFIRNHKRRPFFCYIPTNAPHSPFHVEEKYIEPYKGNPNIPNPNFYGMITNLDENIGKLRDELKKMGISENTIFVFMTDNGTAAGVKFGDEGEVISGYNADMRGIKGSPYDGGHRVPFFIHWPKGEFENGRDISTITSYVDFKPTILDLCGIEVSSNKSLDGVSLKPLIAENDEEWPERVIFSDTQREEYLVKWKQFAAITDRWRLVGKDELYDIKIDPGQTNNVASEYPGVVEKLLAAYEVWWQDVSRDADKYNRVKIGTPHENPIRLNSHDLHTTKGYPAWSQSMVRAGNGSNGFWAVEIVNPGAYKIELCRWPKESGLKIRESAPVGDNVPGGKSFITGKPLNIKTARIKIGEIGDIKKVKKGDSSVMFKVKLKKEKSIIQTWMTDEKGNEWPAYYVYIKRI